MERNIVNIVEIEKFIDVLRQRTGERTDIAVWLSRNVRNYLIRHHPDICEVTIATSEDPLWVKRDLARGRAVHRIRLNNQLYQDISHVIDFFFANPKLQLSRLAVLDALAHGKRWMEELELQAGNNRIIADVQDEGNIFPIILYDNGYRWVKILTAAGLSREGRLMKNCVSSYVGRKNTVIYSLRDENNQPHVTVNVNSIDNKFIEGKGKANQVVQPKAMYRSYLLHLLIVLRVRIGSAWDLPNLWSFPLFVELPGLVEEGQLSEYVMTHYQEVVAWLLKPQLMKEIFSQDNFWQEVLRCVKQAAILPEGRLYQCLSLSPQFISDLLVNDTVCNNRNYSTLCNDVFGIRKSADLRPFLTELTLANISKYQYFCHYWCKNTSDSLSTILRLKKEEIQNLLGINPDFINILEMWEIDSIWLPTREDVLQYIRVKFEEIKRSDNFLYDGDTRTFALQTMVFMQKVLKYGVVDIKFLCCKIPHLLYCLQPNVHTIPVEFFSETDDLTLFTEYCYDVKGRPNRDCVKDACRLGELLVGISSTQQNYDQIPKLIDGMYPNFETVTSNLRRLGVSTTSSVIERYCSGGIKPIELQEIAIFLPNLPNYLLQGVCISKWYYGKWTTRLCEPAKIGKWFVIYQLVIQWERFWRQEKENQKNMSNIVHKPSIVGQKEYVCLLFEDLFRLRNFHLDLVSMLSKNGGTLNQQFALLLSVADEYTKAFIEERFSARRKNDILIEMKSNTSNKVQLALDAALYFCEKIADYLYEYRRYGFGGLKLTHDVFWLYQPMGILWQLLSVVEQQRLEKIWCDAAQRNPAELADKLAIVTGEIQFSILRILPYVQRDKVCMCLLDAVMSKWEVVAQREQAIEKMVQSTLRGIFFEGERQYWILMNGNQSMIDTANDPLMIQREIQEESITCPLDNIIAALLQERQKNNQGGSKQPSPKVLPFQPQVIRKIKIADLSTIITAHMVATLDKINRLLS